MQKMRLLSNWIHPHDQNTDSGGNKLTTQIINHMTFNTQVFKDFFAYTKAMKDNPILTIYQYIRLTCAEGVGTLEKSNGAVFCRMRFETTETCDLLIEEIEIKTLVQSTKSGDITIEQSVDQIVLSNGNLDLTSNIEDVTNYPAFPEFNDTATPVNTGLLAIAARYTDPKHMGWLQYVVADKNGVLGTDNMRIFHNATPFPDLVITTECCQIIAGLGECNYSKHGNYDFFSTSDVTYGFIQCPFGVPDYMPVVSKIEKGTFSLSKSDLLLFCEAAATRSDKEAIMSNNGENSIKLVVQDKDKSKKTEMVFAIEGQAEEFKFSPRKMIEALSPLPYNKLNLSSGNFLSITSGEDENYKGLLQKII